MMPTRFAAYLIVIIAKKSTGFTQSEKAYQPKQFHPPFVRWVDVVTTNNTKSSPAIGYMPYSLASTRYGEMPNMAIIFCINNVTQKLCFARVI